MTIRETIARWICPQLGKDADAWWKVQTDASYLKRWIGGEYVVAEVVIDHLLIGVRNYSRSLNEKPIDHNYPYLGGSWPSEIYAFREKLRATFAPSQPLTTGNSTPATTGRPT